MKGWRRKTRLEVIPMIQPTPPLQPRDGPPKPLTNRVAFPTSCPHRNIVPDFKFTAFGACFVSHVSWSHLSVSFLTSRTLRKARHSKISFFRN
ncbi:hypothetical protein L6452_34263 [Arctium lappa]|uniref:Uncharacterized protein n=1 Tax=Arctium lappa TaxID=4217 RepID=A0ACB8YIE4_ARCLA|nr:hypothetical protein L6452_34263 [Arctium lappa]